MRSWAALAVALAACAHFQRGVGGTWHLATSPHFRVFAPEGYAGPAAERLEVLHTELARQFPSVPSAPLRIDVLVLSSVGELETAFGYELLGAASYTDDGLHIAMSVESLEDESRFPDTIAHELTHSLSMYAAQRQPRWVAEGLAEYLETILVSSNDRVVVGRVEPWELAYRRRLLLQTDWGVEHRGHTLDWLWAWGEPGFQNTKESTGIGYSLAGAWVHMLVDRHPGETQAFLRALQRAESQKAAFAEAFKATPVELLERQLVAHVVGEPQLSYRAAAPRAAAAPAVRTITRAELHLARALALTPTGLLNEAELQEALALDSALRDAKWLAIERLPIGHRLEEGLRFAELERSDVSWARLTEVLVEARSLDVDYRRKLAEIAARMRDDPRAQMAAAMSCTVDGDLAAGRKFIERSLELAPWSARAHFVAARIYAYAGECPDARAQKEILIGLMRRHGSSPPPEAQNAIDALTCPAR